MLVNADLHIHGRYSGAVSEKMTIKNLARESGKKGIQLLGTGDCLHPKWRREFEHFQEIDEGTFELDGTRFVMTTEVEDSSRVHHILIFPSTGAVDAFRKKISKSSKNIDTDGRPNVSLGGEEIAQHAKDVDALIGASHAFTPWTSMYAYHDSLKSLYGGLVDYVSFIELGLSADTNYADRIGELADVTFLTNSDAHSPYPVRLAREFNRFEMDDNDYNSLKKAILRKGNNKSILNVGLPPQEGKYNETACTRCYTHYEMERAKLKKWRCRCGGLIKKGVRDRIEELSDHPRPVHPDHRPEYVHLIPLAEIIRNALGLSTPFAKKVFEVWNGLIKRFGDEISVLVDAGMDDIKDNTSDEIAQVVKLFRENKIMVKPGGGGQYGRIVLPGSEEYDEVKKLNSAVRPQAKKMGQRSLLDY
ncbi:MAG: TIGR00375 family protein [Thermoplasmata archaeon]|nr:TIGR00375 family protein [Thermoplasmata archaeon]